MREIVVGLALVTLAFIGCTKQQDQVEFLRSLSYYSCLKGESDRMLA